MTEHRVAAHLGIDNTYDPLQVELALLADAGFQRPDYFWRRGPMTVFGGFA
jgi:hypothetical protein